MDSRSSGQNNSPPGSYPQGEKEADDDDIPLGTKYSPNDQASPYTQPPPYYDSASPSAGAPLYTSGKVLAPQRLNASTSRPPPPSPPLYAPPYPPDPSSPSAGTTGNGKKGIMSKLTTPDLLNPPPPSFTRPAPPNLSYPPFPQCALVSKGSSLRKGFDVLPPRTTVAPHPFVTHDVTAADWARFVGDVQRAARLSIMEHVVAGTVPAIFGLGIVGGILVSQGIEYGMRRKKRKAAAVLVEHWNQNFFNPRMIDVSLVRGQTVHTGTGTMPAVSTPGSSTSSTVQQPAQESSSDSESDGNVASGSSKNKKQGKGKKRAEKKNSGPWKLVLSYKPRPPSA